MPWSRLLPAAIALAVLAAHFHRAGLAWLVPACVGLMLLLFIRLAWVPRVVAVALFLASAEWLRTLVVLTGARIDAGEPWLRLAAILGGVTIATLLTAWQIRSAVVTRWYRDGT